MPKTNSDYAKIPVTLDVYEQVKLISEANGFGERGLGKQIAAWAAKELPECNHKKTPVTIETFPASQAASLVQVSTSVVTGWYCPTCKRVYAKAVKESMLTGAESKLIRSPEIQDIIDQIKEKPAGKKKAVMA